MEYRRLGTSDLSISTVSLGTWSFGSSHWRDQQPDEEYAGVIEAALDRGINILDTAPGYQRSQEIIGKALKKLGPRRRDLYIATKAT